MKHLLLIFAISTGAFLNAQFTAFNYTGQMDSIQIPECVDSIIIDAWGAQGEDAVSGGVGGLGAYAGGRINVSTGQWIYINVGGTNGYNGGGAGGANGFIDGGGSVDPNSGGSGGGASDVRIGGMDLADRILVAGGGGGAGHNGVWLSCQPAQPGGDGGAGGAADGTMGSSTACSCAGGGGTGGTAGSISAGGTGGVYNTGACGGGYSGQGSDGALGLGGDGNTNYYNGTGGAGGGGGGYYGGGSGGNGWDTTPGGGGGGGSSYIGGVIASVETQGVKVGQGLVNITFVYSQPIIVNTIVLNGVTLSAIQSGLSYQWLDCDNGMAVVPGATSQDFTPSEDGNYAVQLNNGTGCIDTSACLAVSGVGLTDFELIGARAFPNPTNDYITIAFTGDNSIVKVELLDIQGKLIISETAIKQTMSLDFSNLDEGVYLIKLVNDKDEEYIQQIIKR
jgi:hypothetical protein